MTPEDYELMCQAAKAAGYDIWWKTGTCKGGPYMSAFIGDKPWRPLEDDGDAVRLLLDTAKTESVDVRVSRGWFMIDTDGGTTPYVFETKNKDGLPEGAWRRPVLQYAAAVEHARVQRGA